jgi:flagellar basal-body rod protein FlgG
MANGLQIAASGLIAQEWRLDAVANDIANVNTVGYRQSRSAFSEVLGTSGGVVASTLGASSAPGALAQSDNPLSVALDGPGYIQVRTSDGKPALTRDGNLHLDGARRLAVSAGATIDPPVAVPAHVSANEVSIAGDGTVTAHGRKLGRIALVDVPAPDALEVRSDGLLATTAASGAAKASTTASLRQGMVEQSNVDLATALTDMMEAQRGFQLASKALHTQDQLLEIVNGIRR